MAERAKLGVEAPDIDVSAFSPKQPTKPDVPIDIIREASEKAGMISREPHKKSAKKLDRRRRTGRNIQISAKVSERAQELIDEIYDGHKNPDGTAKWTIGQILEFGLEAFKRELEQGRES